MARNEDVYLEASGFEMIIPAMEMMGAKVTEVIKEDNLVSYRIIDPDTRVVMTIAVFMEDGKDESK